MNIEKLYETLAGQPKFRLKQAKEAIFKDLIDDWAKATVLPLSLRQELNKECPLKINNEFFVSKAKDSTKALIRLEDGLKIESVLLRHSDNRNTVCVSSQVGCPLNCSFCATGKMGFKRNLEYFEIAEQVILFARLLKKENKRVSNIVFMGMGEPFLNYDNVLRAIKIINAEDGLNIGARHISISTIGIIEGIKKLAKENLQINLAISLHAPNDKLRERIMPINKKYPIERVLQAVDDYMAKTKRKVMFEYLLIDNVNDTLECALELAKLMKKPLYFLNLISYNPTGVFTASPFKKIKEFKNILEKSGVNVAQRYRFGQDIDAACGQLAGKN
ncbi:23S rRNA (adenine(2503)-C(2))-methyltransferase RlmN [Patescibacteria group bacterium]|nr:23S rRNA (adenine(2503)-C(2))-methyltransferase RlmN [Patescibacteria group bacterium]